MSASDIKNVVFDVGNVIVRWHPPEITRLTFGEVESLDALTQSIFANDIWFDLNRGLLTEAEAMARYRQEVGISELESERLFHYIKHSLIPLHGTVDLMQRLKAAGYRIFALTDNVHELVAYLKSTYDFWELFEGVTVSAEVGALKPSAEIYHSLLNSHNIVAAETVFLDDMPHNVEGAQAVGIAAIQFINARQCEERLIDLGISF